MSYKKNKKWIIMGFLMLSVGNFIMYINSFLIDILNFSEFNKNLKGYVSLFNNLYVVLTIIGGVLLLLYLFSKLKDNYNKANGWETTLNLSIVAGILIIAYAIILKANNLFISSRSTEYIFQCIYYFIFDSINIVFCIFIILIAFNITKNSKKSITSIFFRILASIQGVVGVWGILFLDYNIWVNNPILQLNSMFCLRVHWFILTVIMLMFPIVIKRKFFEEGKNISNIN